MLEVDTEKYLHCPICQEMFEDPVTLQCYHTYCRKCLHDFLKSRSYASRDKTIPCALNCEGTKPPDPRKPPAEWAYQLRPSFMVSNLIEDYNRTVGRQCSRCSRHDTRAQAVKWCQMCGQSLCETCISSHRRDPTTHLHTITDLPQRSEKQSQPFPRCEWHQDEIVKLICEDCNKAICNTCCSLSHRLCESVVLMDSRRHQITENVKTQKSKLEGRVLNASTSIATIRSKYDQMLANKTYEQKRIKDLFTKIKDHLKEKETMLLHELGNVIDKQTDTLKQDLQLEENRLQLLRQRVHFIEQAVSSDSLFDMYRMCQSLWTDDVSETGIKPQDPVRRHVRYLVNSDELMEDIKGHEFGMIHVGHESSSKARVTKLFGPIASYFSDEENEPDVYDISVLEVGGIPRIVVTDCYNECVKSMYSRDNKTYYSRLVLDKAPCGITQLKDNVIVAIPGSRQIVTVAVDSDLEQLSTLSTSKRYFSLGVVGDTSVAAGCRGCVDILNMEGEVMNSFSTHNDTLFSHPWHMCVSNTGHLLVSDWKRKSVACLTREGEVEWIYTGSGDEELRDPRGITTTSAGDIMVVDNKLKKVIQLSSSGEYVNTPSSRDCNGYPRGICVNTDGSLFICKKVVVKEYITV